MSEQDGSGDRSEESRHFIQEIIDEDLRNGKNGGRVVTRFPPEPSGHLHIGHAMAINLSFSMAAEFSGVCNLRFDDTNPEAEDTQFVEAIQEDVRWLGFDWGDQVLFTSDYFQRLYDYAIVMIKKGLAFVDSSSPEDIRTMRGNFYKPGVESPHRGRSIEENLDLFERMRAGEFEDGSCVLRAKIDMQSPDLNFRDPLMYRVLRAHHHRTGDEWSIYPMYDFAHGLSDSIEGVTHSLCSLEFVDHRPLYNWFLEACEVENRPEQTEFAKLKMTYTVMSKRLLQKIVDEKYVDGWSDPRMPTLGGMRQRGYPAAAILRFVREQGVTKRESTVDLAQLEYCVRDELNVRAPRVMGVLRPLKVVIENYPEGQVDELDAPNHPNDPSLGTRKIPLSRVVYIERDDFSEDPPGKWFRLAPGREVRLRNACLITCTGVIKDPDTGEVTELRCSWDPDSRGGAAADGRKVKGTLHWVSAEHAIEMKVKLFDRLFRVENPMANKENFLEAINPDSLEILSGCWIEPSFATAQAGDCFQLERLGYFRVESTGDAAEPLTLLRTVSLRDTWAKTAKKQGRKG